MRHQYSTLHAYISAHLVEFLSNIVVVGTSFEILIDFRIFVLIAGSTTWRITVRRVVLHQSSDDGRVDHICILVHDVLDSQLLVTLQEILNAGLLVFRNGGELVLILA